VTYGRSEGVTRAIAEANSGIGRGQAWIDLYRWDVQALLDHISDLEFEVSKLKGTSHLATLHRAFNRRAD